MDEKKYETQKPMMYDIKEHEFACGMRARRKLARAAHFPCYVL